MMCVPTVLRMSRIHGIGVFLLQPVKKGNLVWRLDSRFDRVFPETEVNEMPGIAREYIETYGCFYESLGFWVVAGDNARHFNHSENPSTLPSGAGHSEAIAAFDLDTDMELTSNYHLICDATKNTGTY